MKCMFTCKQVPCYKPSSCSDVKTKATKYNSVHAEHYE